MTGLAKHQQSWLKKSEAKPGMAIECDSGFSCLPAFSIRLLQSDNGDLFFRCNHGRHYLDGQLADGVDGEAEYVGIWEV